ncbi:response regulator transcription factor [Actinomadura harenae]|uniref:DNA-binding response regulator n=1 Tax=Actinomadura harenae TaxID=2483351 RepID=A0A3M2M1Q6_9ACTN|nr:response regulator transcription factor [Actinomadura harenae]RMI43476.1 DNA-binding response regulator [Actinomadura harenae]
MSGQNDGTIGVMIVDDHPIVREGLRGMLVAEPDLTVVGEAASGPEAVAVVPRLRPDVILMDLRMPGGSGLNALRLLAPEYRIIVLTTFAGHGDIAQAIAAGAAGYLLKDASRGELALAVRTVAAGGRALCRDAADRLAAAESAPALSEREAQVLELVARGLTNAEVGGELHIGEATVKTHLLRVFAKLGVSDRMSAVMAAMRRGLISGEGRP